MRMKTESKIFLTSGIVALFIIVAAQGVLAQDVRYNFDRDADFSKYKTYKWVDNKNAERLSDLGDRQVKSAIDAELAKKGLSKVDSDNPDLYLSYQVAVGQEKQYTSFDSGWGYGPGWRSWGATGSSMSTGQTSTIHIGGLDVDMYDTGKKQLVWEGVVSKTIDPKAKPDKQQKNLEKAVAKLLKNYPPAEKK